MTSSRTTSPTTPPTDESIRSMYDKETIYRHLTAKTLFQDDAMDDLSSIIDSVFAQVSDGGEGEHKEINDVSTLITPILLSGPRGSGKSSSIEHLVKLFDMHKGGENEKGFIRCNLSDHKKEKYGDQLQAMYNKFSDAFKYCGSTPLKPVVIVLFENIQDINAYTLESLNTFVTNGRIYPKDGDFTKYVEVLHYTRLVLIFTSNFGVNRVKPESEQYLVYEGMKGIIEDEMRSSLGKTIPLYIKRWIPFLPITKKNLEQLLLPKFDEYIKNTHFSQKYGSPSIDDSLKAMQMIMASHDNDGNIGKAFNKLETGLQTFMEFNCSHIRYELPHQTTVLSPKPNIVCESYPYGDDLNEEMMNNPLFKRAVLNRVNRRSFDAVLTQKSDLDILKMEHSLLKTPCLSIMYPATVNINHIKIQYNDHHLQDQLNKTMVKLEECQNKLQNSDQKLCMIAGVIELSDSINPKTKRVVKSILSTNINLLTNYELLTDNDELNDNTKKSKKRKEAPDNSTEKKHSKKKVKVDNDQKSCYDSCAGDNMDITLSCPNCDQTFTGAHAKKSVFRHCTSRCEHKLISKAECKILFPSKK